MTSKHQDCKLQHLVIKPILSCTANCPTCTCRQQLHRDLRRRKQLSFEDWKRVLAEARNLGVLNFTISGGEPTLYKQLPDLIKIGRRYGWMVKINSNGSLINENYAEKLLEAGLNMIDISLYSPIPHVHNSMRKSKDLWRKATSAIKIFVRLGKKYPGFKVMTQTILCHDNYKDFADLLKLHYNLGSSGMLVSYLEGDFEKKHLFDESEIQYFKTEVLPRAIEICEELDPYVRDAALFNVKQVFSENLLSSSDWADGVYRSENKTCTIPKKQALILANGEVHPCNIVEYIHEPVMGNLFESSLPEIWHSKKWNRYRQNLHEKCELCPMNHHVYIPLRGGNKLVAIAKLYMQKTHLNYLETLLNSMYWKYKVRMARLLQKK